MQVCYWMLFDVLQFNSTSPIQQLSLIHKNGQQSKLHMTVGHFFTFSLHKRYVLVFIFPTCISPLKLSALPKDLMSMQW